MNKPNKMKSEDLNPEKEQEGPDTNAPVKQPKQQKPKRRHFLKKLKLKKGASTCSEPDPATIPLPGTSSDSSAGVERQTPEGDESYKLTKSASENNLAESWACNEGSKSDKRSTENVIAKASQFGSADYKGRTKSLENIRKMTAYGELIVDASTLQTVKFNNFVFSVQI